MLPQNVLPSFIVRVPAKHNLIVASPIKDHVRAVIVISRLTRLFDQCSRRRKNVETIATPDVTRAIPPRCQSQPLRVGLRVPVSKCSIKFPVLLIEATITLKVFFSPVISIPKVHWFKL